MLLRAPRFYQTAAILAVTLLASTRAAAVPTTMTYQGRLTDPAGNPREGEFNMTFRIYSTPTGGIRVWEEPHNNLTGQVQTDRLGLFEVLLGRDSALTAEHFPDGQERYLEIEVNGEILSPRKPLNSVPYAFTATTAGELWQTDGTNVYRSAGNVGIGTPTPYTKLMVAGDPGTAALVRSTSGTAQIALLSGEPGTGRQYNIASTASGELQIQDTSAGGTLPVRIQGGAPSDVLLIGSGGNVGIGTLPGAGIRLQVAGGTMRLDGSQRMEWGDGSSYIAGGPSDINLRTNANITFATVDGSLERMRIDPDGDVGIGTTNPTEKLQVAGVLHSTAGGFKFPDGSIQTTAASRSSGQTAVGSYIGDGTNSRDINIGFTPHLVFIQRDAPGPEGVYNFRAIHTGTSGTWSGSQEGGNPNTKDPARFQGIVANGFRTGTNGSATPDGTNEIGITYFYFAIRH